MLKSSVEVMFASERHNFSLRCCLFMSLNSLDAIQTYRLAAEIWQRRLPSNNFFILSGTENNTLVVIICRGHMHRFGSSAHQSCSCNAGAQAVPPWDPGRRGHCHRCCVSEDPSYHKYPELNPYNTGVPSATGSGAQTGTAWDLWPQTSTLTSHTLQAPEQGFPASLEFPPQNKRDYVRMPQRFVGSSAAEDRDRYCFAASGGFKQWKHLSKRQIN